MRLSEKRISTCIGLGFWEEVGIRSAHEHLAHEYLGGRKSRSIDICLRRTTQRQVNKWARVVNSNGQKRTSKKDTDTAFGTEESNRETTTYVIRPSQIRKALKSNFKLVFPDG